MVAVPVADRRIGDDSDAPDAGDGAEERNMHGNGIGYCGNVSGMIAENRRSLAVYPESV